MSNPLNYFNIDNYSCNKIQPPNIIRLANIIEKRLQPYATRITLAGSIRRGEEPRDIDIVLIPKNIEGILGTISNMGGSVWNSGTQQVYFKLRGVDVNIYYATPETYGAQLMTRTGPREGNIGNRTLAKSKGMTLNQYGLYKGEKRIAGRTEHEIYAKLGKKYKVPELRGR